jgi:hypothetical protein
MPYAWNFLITLRTGTFARNVILTDDMPDSFHQPIIALWIKSIFILPHLAASHNSSLGIFKAGISNAGSNRYLHPGLCRDEQPALHTH